MGGDACRRQAGHACADRDRFPQDEQAFAAGSQRIGTHHVLFGAVEDVFIGPYGSPLIYANRAYGTPARL